jgi:cell division septation protein DedD
LGGFIANYKPAAFDAYQKTVLPPSRQILFNPNLVHNDGLLYAHISKETDYGYKEVQAMAEVYFKTIQYEVGKGLKFVIEDLGYFFLNKARKIEFAHETTDNLLLASYGLSFLNYKEFSKKTGIPKVSGRSEKTYQAVEETNPIIRQRRIRRWIYTGAAACLVASMILIPMKMGYLNLSSFDLSPVDSFRKEQPVKELVVPSLDNDTQQVKPEAGPTTAEAAFTGIEPEGLQTETVPSEIEASSEASENEIPARKYFTPQKNYHIIVGSFKDIGNAQHLQQKMIGEGYDAEVITGENDFFRVSARQFPSRADAVSALPSIRGQEAYKSAWILSL